MPHVDTSLANCTECQADRCMWQAETVWIVKATVGHRTMSVTKPDRWLVPLSAAASGKSIGDKHVEAVK